MNLNPLDIIIAVILIIFTLSGLYARFISTIKMTINLIASIFLSNFILTRFGLISQVDEIMNLVMFFLLFIILSLLIGFLLNFAIYQREDPELDPIADKVLGGLVGITRGFIISAILIFIFDTTPVSLEIKDKITKRMELESFLYAPCNNLKEILIKD
jgi:RsiW-degrading membrane proteinase PrsW (M82 family)